MERLLLHRGTFEIAADTKARHGSNGGHLPDTYLSTPGWIKGVAWVNGFNLGWYWPQVWQWCSCAGQRCVYCLILNARVLLIVLYVCMHA